jgi:hypothetical protein
MKHKPESWNGATSDAIDAIDAIDATSSRGARRSLTRAGLGQLSHVVSGALSTLQGGSNARGAAQNRMRALLNQDRALLSHRACGQATLEEAAEPDAPELPALGSQTRGAAQNRMRELLNQDRALLALREARKRENPAAEPLDDDFAAELVQLVHLDQLVDREWTPHQAQVYEQATVATSTTVSVTASVETSVSASRSTCVGVTASFVAEPAVATVCTPGLVQHAMPAPNVAPVTPVTPVTPVAPVAPVVIAPIPVAKPVASLRPVAAPHVAIPGVTQVVAQVATQAGSGAESAAGDPIRTRGMAKLLALQGYRDRALSIYDELIAIEPENADLRAEADRLRL